MSQIFCVSSDAKSDDADKVSTTRSCEKVSVDQARMREEGVKERGKGLTLVGWLVGSVWFGWLVWFG